MQVLLTPRRLTIWHKHQVTSTLDTMHCRCAILVEEKLRRVNSRVPSAVHSVHGRQQRPKLRPVYRIIDRIIVPVNWRATSSRSNIELEHACGIEHVTFC